MDPFSFSSQGWKSWQWCCNWPHHRSQGFSLESLQILAVCSHSSLALKYGGGWKCCTRLGWRRFLVPQDWSPWLRHLLPWLQCLCRWGSWKEEILDYFPWHLTWLPHLLRLQLKWRWWCSCWRRKGSTRLLSLTGIGEIHKLHFLACIFLYKVCFVSKFALVTFETGRPFFDAVLQAPHRSQLRKKAAGQ